MSKTVAIISDSGRLIDVGGTPKEDNARYLNFAQRLLGSANSTAVLNYGWNGDAKLTITGANGTGDRITLDAREVVIPGSVTIGGKTIQELIEDCVEVSVPGLVGVEDEIEVQKIPNPDYDSSDSSGDQPEDVYVISLAQALRNRIDDLDAKVEALFRFDDVYYAGDGLVAERDPHTNNTINVRLGYGLKFVEVDDSGSSDPVYVTRPPTAVAIDPAALHIGNVIEVDPATGNMVLYANEED